MSQTLGYPGSGTPARSSTHTLFAQTMGYVAVTTGFFALGPTWAGTCPTAGPSWRISSLSPA